MSFISDPIIHHSTHLVLGYKNIFFLCCQHIEPCYSMSTITVTCALNLVEGLSVLWKHLWRSMSLACLFCKQMFHITVLIHLLPVALKSLVFCHAVHCKIHQENTASSFCVRRWNVYKNMVYFVLHLVTVRWFISYDLFSFRPERLSTT